MRPLGVDKQPVQCKASLIAPQTQMQPLHAAGLRALLQINHADACFISTAAAVFKQPCTSNVWGPAAVQAHALDQANAAAPAPEAPPSHPNAAGAVTVSPSPASNVKLLASLFEISRGSSSAGESTTAHVRVEVAAEADAAVLVSLATTGLEKAPSVRELLHTWESRSAPTASCSLTRTSSTSSSSSWSSGGSASVGGPRPATKPCLRPLTAAAPARTQEASAAVAPACSITPTSHPQQQAQVQQQQCQEQEQQLLAAQQSAAGAAATPVEQRAASQGWSAAMSLVVCSAVVSTGLCCNMGCCWVSGLQRLTMLMVPKCKYR